MTLKLDLYIPWKPYNKWNIRKLSIYNHNRLEICNKKNAKVQILSTTIIMKIEKFVITKMVLSLKSYTIA